MTYSGNYEREHYFQGMCDAFACAAGEDVPVDRLAALHEAHDWGCDCTSDDPCRILIALDGGPSRPERHFHCTCRDTFNPKCPEHGGSEHHP